MKERCLNLLNLPLNATKADIKKAYRKLAFEYHPDKNPSKEAQAKFIELTKAYEFLINDKRSTFKSVFSNSKSNATTDNSVNQKKEKEVPEWFKKYRETVKQKKETDSTVYSKIKSSFIYKLSKILAFFSGTLILILLLNYVVFSPNNIEVKVTSVTHVDTHKVELIVIDSISNKLYTLQIKSENQFSLFNHIDEGKSFYIYVTPLLNDVISINHTVNRSEYMVENQNSMSTFYGLYLLIFIPFLIINFLDGKNIFYLMAIDGKTIITTIILLEYLIHASVLKLFDFL